MTFAPTGDSFLDWEGMIRNCFRSVGVIMMVSNIFLTSRIRNHGTGGHMCHTDWLGFCTTIRPNVDQERVVGSDSGTSRCSLFVPIALRKPISSTALRGFDPPISMITYNEHKVYRLIGYRSRIST